MDKKVIKLAAKIYAASIVSNSLGTGASDDRMTDKEHILFQKEINNVARKLSTNICGTLDECVDIANKIINGRKFVVYLKSIHYKCKTYLDIKDYNGLVIYMKTFIRPDVDPYELQMILVITNSFKEHEILKDMIKELSDLQTSKLGKPRP